MTTAEIPRDQFLKDVIAHAEKQVITNKLWRQLPTNYRGNVVVIQPSNAKGCHYEIGLHQDCHEIALHFQGTPQNNSSRLEGFRPYIIQLNSYLDHQVILGPHEHKGRKRLWIKLPLNPFTHELVKEYGDLLAKLIIYTYPILRDILDKEKSTNIW